MCGIVGYVGNKNTYSILNYGLKKLEYRGYDSCGIATIYDNKIHIYKSISGIDDLYLNIKTNETSNIGIGHTRWATHGVVNLENAHPHIDNSKRFVVVHNGIVENYLELKELLVSEGYKFYTETDTEVIPNLINMNYKGNLLAAVKKSTDMLKGSYALGVMSNDNPNELIATKRNSPLVIGFGKDENFIASDFSALLKYTSDMSILENNEFAVLNRNCVSFYDNDLKLKDNPIKHIDNNDCDIEKNGYEHFMLKEINENTITVKKTLDRYLKESEIDLCLNLDEKVLKKIKHIHIIACGTAMHAGLNGKYVIEKLTRVPVNVEVASEFRYKNPIIDKDDLAIFISQSGETADTIACLELIRERNINHISIVNVKESTIDRLSDNCLYTVAGPEIAVASTKAYVAQVILIDLFAIYLAKQINSYEGSELDELIKELNVIPTKMQEVLDDNALYVEYAKKIYKAKDMFYLGRGIDYYIALEGSLKLKEISYIHSEAVQFGELKHGPIALIENNTNAIAICTNANLLDKSISNIKEIKARGADVLILTTLKNFNEDMGSEVIILPEINELFSPLISIVPLQLIAYHVTVLKGLNVDKPRNLAKSVTVE